MTGAEKREVDPLTFVDGGQCSRDCFEGDSTEGSEEDITARYTESSTESHTYTKTQGFSLSADTSGVTGKFFRIIDLKN